MLSKRLETVAGMVTPGNVTADIGTDHGYVPIYLIKNGICPKAYAMDINEGPIKSAIQNIRVEGLSEQIEVIQSDGMEKLEPEMADTVIIAGMGGELMVNILENSKVNHTVKEFILSPHRRGDLVRKYITHIDWHITDEKMLVDAGKFYTVMKAEKGRDEIPYNETEYIYGRILLDEKNPVLKEYLEKENNKFQKILETMKKSGNSETEQVEHLLKHNEKGRRAYD